MSRKASPVVVGSFVVGGIALLIVGLVLLGTLRLFQEKQRFVVYFDSSVFGLRIGAPVMFKGIPVGRVNDMRIDSNQKRSVEVILEMEKNTLVAGREKMELDEETVRQLVEDGLRAELALESFVTNLRYVALDFRPDTPAELADDPTDEYPEIPTIPAMTEELQENLVALVDQLARTDIEGLVASIRDLADSTRNVIASPDLQRALAQVDDLALRLDGAMVELTRTARAFGPNGELGKNLASASKNVEVLTARGSEAAMALGVLLHPDGAFLAGVEETLGEIHDAARSLRQVSDQISRDPGSVLRGGQQ